MNDVALLAEEAIQYAQQTTEDEPLQVNPMVRNLFMLLHGAYGNLFISKFSTGEKDKRGRDKGIRAAMKVWEAALGKFPAEVVETAAGRLTKDHPEFPPNLPQFEKLCDAAAPRKTYAEENNLPRLAAPVAEPVKVSLEPKNDGKDWARRILYRVERGDKSVRAYALQCARQALGLEGRQAWQ
jgi:hypothetical protein